MSEKARNTGFRTSELFLSVVLLLLAGRLDAQPTSAVEQVDVPFFADGSTLSFSVALDRIGILPRRDMRAGDVESLGKAFEGTLLQSFPGGIHVFKLASNGTRQSLSKLARQARDESHDIRQAGLVLYREGGELPVVVSDELVVQFRVGTTETAARELAMRWNLAPVMQNPLIKEQWLFRLIAGSDQDVLDAARIANGSPRVLFSQPNFFAVKTYRNVISTDQWHHINNGHDGGTIDADIDSDLAWQFSRGSPEITIAVIDQSFDIDHPDIASNLWTNPDEIPGNNSDDPPGNGYVDDIHGYNFFDCTNMTGPSCGTGMLSDVIDPGVFFFSDQNHGTAVAGLAAGNDDNGITFSGVCPDCSLILIQTYAGADGDSGSFADGLAVGYAGLVGARIVSNSWGYENIPVPASVASNIAATTETGAIIFWAMSNNNQDDCAGGDISADPNVIPVSAVSNQDRKVTKSGFGDCMAILAPSHKGYGPNGGFPYTGTLNIATTDRNGPGDFNSALHAGYNNEQPPNDEPGYGPDYCPTDTSYTSDRRYTRCFGGTSASTPIAAGVGALVLSADTSLMPDQVRRILQDTADKTEPSAAMYGESTGFSGSSTHGYGRVNAFEAVKLVAPRTDEPNSGLGGTDIFLRDNDLDWGNTAQLIAAASSWRIGSNVLMEDARGFIPHYESADIKIDAPDSMGNYRAEPTATDFDAYEHDNPISGALNKVYVRVHNRGPNPALNVRVKLYWVWAGPALPPLPEEFWDDWPAEPTSPGAWHSLGSEMIDSLEYSGASIAGTEQDASEIITFNFTGPPLDPSLPGFRHHCLFAVVDSPDDPISVGHLSPDDRLIPDIVTPSTNNVTHLNVSVQDATADGLGGGMMIRNPFPRAAQFRLISIKPKNWDISFSQYGDGETFKLAAGKEVPVTVEIKPEHGGATGNVEIRQEVLVDNEFRPFGGFVFRHRNNK